MKKIIRIASVIALASASLLYVGCTKDFSADIAKTNQDVAALNQKVESLNSTVQTINGTVESLKTTKADLSKVEELDAAIKSALEKKIGELEESLKKTAGDASAAAADAAAAKTDAAAAQAAADAVAEDLEKANAKLDTVIADVKNVADSLDIVAANVKALRADVDSLQNWQAGIDNAIKKLTGKVEALAVRITSIVAVPSEYYEFQKFVIDTVGVSNGSLDTNIFKSTFVVAPASAVADLNAANFKVYLKEGLTRGTATPTPIDTVLAVKKIVKNETNGTVTVFAGIKAFPTAAEGKQIYYSLAYNGEDGAGEYSEYSEFVKAHNAEDTKILRLANIITVKDKATAKEITEAKSYVDTIAYDNAKDTVYKTAFNGRCDVVAKLNGELISLAEFAGIIGTQVKKLAIDTTVTVKDSILVSSDDKCYSARTWGPWPDDYNNPPYKAELDWWISAGMKADGSVNANGIKQIKKGVFAKAKATDYHYFGNMTTVTSNIKVSGNTIGHAITDTLYIGGKNLGTTDLGKSSVEWYYDYAKTGIDKEFKINNKTAAKNLNNDTLTSGFFTLTKVDADYVKVAANGAKYAKVAADTTYNVEWATKYNIGVKADSTFAAFKWAFKAGPRPADPEAIKFAAADTIIGKKAIEVEFEGVYEASIAAIDELDNRSVIDDPVAVSVDGVKLSEKTYKGPKPITFNWTDEKTIVAKIKNAEAGKTYVIVAEANCAGITFTYEFTVTVVSAATPKFKALTTFVKEEGGKYSIEVAAPAPDTAASANNGKYIQKLNSMEFSKYFIVDTTDAVLTGLYAGFKTTDTTSTNEVFVNNTDKSVVGADKVTFDNKKFNWAPYDSTIANVVAYLITSENDTIDNVAIKFWTKEPIKSVAHKDSVIKHNNSNADVINLEGLFTVTDYMDSTVIKNGVTNLKGTWDYDLEFEFDDDKDTWTISGGTLPEGALTLVGNTLTLAAEGAQIVNPVTVEIPFVLSHALDKFGKAADDRQGTVKVTFTSAE